MDIQDVTDHVGRQIAAASIRRDPFPHIEVPDLLPVRYYSELRRNLPSDDECREIDAGQNFEFAPLRRDKMRDGDFWLPFAKEVSQAIVRAALERLAGPADEYLDTIRRKWLIRSGWSTTTIATYANTGADTQVFRRRQGYSSAPHFHSLTETITCLFYFPPDATHAHLGTDLYRVNKPFHASWDELTRYSTVDPSCVELVGRSSFVPNNALIYFNSPWSIHGNTMREVEYDRWFSLITLNVPRNFLARIHPRSMLVAPL